ncbi:methionine sulfoxide reductase A [Nitrobacter sp. Nb-311A]|uniref:peptide-methionine (S)-S-oxide reductase MsrA n=1 Tax=unclassified Nitrobacter TaxID=2620411 RepID=UPI00006870A7|nr:MULTISPECIES: peptide-methionine (S)-S-oxide reductase MsrA [unclassified Nitrobacter]EAQ35785.1 methionine sulfoxide reductase A [Nitrobacter sp. Nb-311A]MCB1393279.1 peptide-methionine (S)-S-oxide reductase MsrA [Nitrobacter sp.]MCV0386350.1 peptide-methionine (S)-S-oxide reductase MsrA [Nitrobacter sp.]
MTRNPFKRKVFVAAFVAGAAALSWLLPGASRAEDAVIIPPSALDVRAANGIQTAVIAGGCFWGVQGVFQHTAGVVNAVSGYAGGAKKTAKYELVSTGTTGHAESVEVRFDPKRISYGKILQIFFSVAHDPTQLNRQGPDTGTQYRSGIFALNDEQKKVADAYIAQLNAARVYNKPIVTKVETLQGFFPAEAYHQDYLTLHPDEPYIANYDRPKIRNLQRVFVPNYIEKPTLVGRARATN